MDFFLGREQRGETDLGEVKAGSIGFRGSAAAGTRRFAHLSILADIRSTEIPRKRMATMVNRVGRTPCNCFVVQLVLALSSSKQSEYLRCSVIGGWLM